MWRYVQKTGELIDPHGEIVAVGYAGNGEHRNRPESEDRPNRGPLPRGTYIIGAPRTTTTHGPYVLPLTPGMQPMHGRAGFLVHGDSRTRPGTASHGCVIVPKAARVRIWESGDRLLTVVAEREDLCGTNG